MENIDYLIYSSHKTSTQTICDCLKKINKRIIHIHELSNRKMTKEDFLDEMNKYIKTNKRKMKIITIIRNPDERLISSYFQLFHTDQVVAYGKKDSDTIISKNNSEEIYKLYKKWLYENNNHMYSESIIEMSRIFNENIIEKLIKNNDFYYYENEKIKLYILNFNKVINDINYLNNCIGEKIPVLSKINCSEDKTYKNKYKIVKEYVKNDIEIKNKIQNDYKEYHSFFYNFEI